MEYFFQSRVLQVRIAGTEQDGNSIIISERDWYAFQAKHRMISPLLEILEESYVAEEVEEFLQRHPEIKKVPTGINGRGCEHYEIDFNDRFFAQILVSDPWQAENDFASNYAVLLRFRDQTKRRSPLMGSKTKYVNSVLLQAGEYDYLSRFLIPGIVEACVKTWSQLNFNHGTRGSFAAAAAAAASSRGEGCLQSPPEGPAALQRGSAEPVVARRASGGPSTARRESAAAAAAARHEPVKRRELNARERRRLRRANREPISGMFYHNDADDDDVADNYQ